MMADTNALVTEIAQLFPPQGRWTERDYFNLPDAMRIIELAHGKLVMPPPPSMDHQDAVLELAVILRQYAKENDLGKVFVAPFAVRLDVDLIREPDVLFISKAHLERATQRGVEGPPNWAAEILSPSTRTTDEVDKLAEYERAGVDEYWLLDPEARTIRIYVLHDGRYADPQHAAVGERASSTIIEGFSVAVKDVL